MSRSNNLAGVTTSILDGVTKAEVGLGNVDNTADTAKPVSTAQQSAIDGLAYQSVPHIIPGVLYPSYVASGTSNKLLDGTTSHSGAFGTVQSDGRKYYYTNIAGSKPIKDPRIGGHFGSQRHKFKSLQLLEQETATHGKNVFTVDGREWLRGVGTWEVGNNTSGNYIKQPNATNNATDRIEIVGYFSGANLIGFTGTADKAEFSVNGGSASTSDFLNASVNTPLNSRYVDAGGVVNLTSSLTLGINTLTLIPDGTAGSYYYGIELIAQDKFTDATCDYNNDPTITMDSTAKLSVGLSVSGTGIPSGATVSSITNSTTFELSASTTGGAVTNGTLTFGGTEISIPAQDVVSYGKKRSITHVSHHYDPFNGFTSGSSVTSYIDTATSLGVEKWKNSSTYYRPYNGGRIVKWVDSSGVIKTSVTLMPPNAKSIGDSSSLTNGTAKANASIANNTFYPTFEAHTTDVNEDLLHEVAKTFHFREFGNGAANGGTGSGSYADASMLNTADDIAYCMDDGTTSLVANNGFINTRTLGVNGSSDSESYITFIGTGIGYRAPNASGSYNSLNNDIVAQNLPYGTHIIRNGRNSGGTLNNVDVDGIEVHDDNSAIQGIEYIDIFQPKRPPIPEDAVVLADYMLMADFVAVNASHDNGRICKGVRRTNGTRDHLYDSSASVTSNVTLSVQYGQEFGFWAWQTGSATGSVKLPFFGTRFTCIFDGQHVSNTLTIDGGSDTYSSGTIKLDNATTGNLDGVISPVQTLGIHNFTLTQPSGSRTFAGTDIATPIHTSSHYESFETPFLHELIGGDRNMEQTNLVCSPDGKSWDEVTRDTSYIGNQCISTAYPTSDLATQDTHPRIHTRWRGTESKTSDWRVKTWLNKDFAIAYDRVICLKDGNYRFTYTFRVHSGVNSPGTLGVILNDADTADSSVTGHILKGYHSDANQVMTLTGNYYLKRGDEISWQGPSVDVSQDVVQIERIK